MSEIDDVIEWVTLLVSPAPLTEVQRRSLAAYLLTLSLTEEEPPRPVVIDEDRCDQTTWRGNGHQPYGPGEFNRCVGNAGHPGRHTDEWGHVWETGGRVIRVVRV